MFRAWKLLAPWLAGGAATAAAAFWFEVVRDIPAAGLAFLPEARWSEFRFPERETLLGLAAAALTLVALRGVAWACRTLRGKPRAGWAPELPILILLPLHAMLLAGLRGAAPLPAWGPWALSAALAGYGALWLRRAGFLAGGVGLASRSSADPAPHPNPPPEAEGGSAARWWFAATCSLAAAWAAVYAALGILQEHALLVPHGDAGMYHEHLWNVWHGKGFRSQLDGGRLFLGEHIEAIHLLLLPAYLLWPGLPVLNVCQAIGLAAGALAVHLLARRLGLPPGVAFAAAVTYLWHFPLQNLAHEPTWKTFRPETLGVPALLFALLALEHARWRAMAACFALAFLAKEEFAIAAAATAPALWLRGERRAACWTAGLSVAYLAFALGVAIPYFRQGSPPHYTPYFASLGDSPGAILKTVLTKPAEVWRRVAAPGAVGFAATMLVPWLLLPMLSPFRLLAAAPIFGYLMLSDRPELRDPWFHFHAPLPPLLAWAFLGGLAKLPPPVAKQAAAFAALFGLAVCVWQGRGPWTWAFHDPHAGIPRDAQGVFKPMGSYWRDRYLPNERSRAFAAAFAAIPAGDRVASTDYIRNRFIQHAAAHDYPLRSHVGIDAIDAFVLDKMEGWWGRDPATNPDHALLAAAAGNPPTGSKVMVRGVAFAVVRSDRFFLALRRGERTAAKE